MVAVHVKCDSVEAYPMTGRQRRIFRFFSSRSCTERQESSQAPPSNEHVLIVLPSWAFKENTSHLGLKKSEALCTLGTVSSAQPRPLSLSLSLSHWRKVRHWRAASTPDLSATKAATPHPTFTYKNESRKTCVALPGRFIEITC
jgi:hypothetical protein